MNEKIEKLIQWIDREYRIGNKENAIKCYQALSEAFQNEINLNLESGEQKTSVILKSLLSQSIDKIKQQTQDE